MVEYIIKLIAGNQLNTILKSLLFAVIVLLVLLTACLLVFFANDTGVPWIWRLLMVCVVITFTAVDVTLTPVRMEVRSIVKRLVLNTIVFILPALIVLLCAIITR